MTLSLTAQSSNHVRRFLRNHLSLVAPSRAVRAEKFELSMKKFERIITTAVYENYNQQRSICSTSMCYGAKQGFLPKKQPEPEVEGEGKHAYQNIYGNLRRPKAKPRRIPEKDRRVPVSWELSAKYLQSRTFKETYGEYKVWQMYRRNFGGPFHMVPHKSRENCIGDDGYIQNNNPCPICRDKYLIIDYRNSELLKQFIDAYTDQLMELKRTHLCNARYEELLTAYIKAKDFGTISFVLPSRNYNYDEYYHKNLLKNYHDKHSTEIVDPVLKKVELYPDYITEDPAATTFPNVLPDSLVLNPN